MEWISVKDRLPEEGARCLCVVVSSDRKYPLVWGWMGNNWAINISDPNLGSHKNITHWMPLPPPPKEQD